MNCYFCKWTNFLLWFQIEIVLSSVLQLRCLLFGALHNAVEYVIIQWFVTKLALSYD